MGESSTKYRGTKEYLLVYSELIRAAQYQGVTTYQAIARIMGLPVTGSYMGNVVGQVLVEICEEEMEHGRPMLSAVAVNVAGSPGIGFFKLARQAGRLQSESKAAEEQFWRDELKGIYGFWKPVYKD